MDLLDLIISYGPWSWIIGGLILLGVELIVPGGVVVWLGGAAIIVGLITLMQPVPWAMQWLLYGVLSIVSLFAWLNYSRRNRGEESDRPFLNKRALRYIGQEAVLEEPISGGRGRISLDDSVWRVIGPDLPEGARVRVTGADGAVLRVEAA
ncbi:NfeD family protein [Mariluticola halotolerans]|uniref:NfeD family protein n=1 Tax=Mariluticola halotolerans TaxID=2909283 RepID=UPI0026E37F84|nr:NfeD family protein [Mariluticola halotolerans]UJQ93939.1 NfeD family protein [Mariluticola halotolerans]